MAQLIRLLTLLAVLLMPMSMAAPATAHPTMDMAMSHCPDQSPHHQPKGAFAECTMACASALPAVDILIEDLPPLASIVIIPSAVVPLHGLHPDTATPPPKLS